MAGLSWILTVAIAATLVGCAPSSAPSSAGPASTPGAAANVPTSKSPSDDRWNKIVADARNEETVTIYTSYGPSQTAALRRGFKDAYGLDIDFVAGRGPELAAKLSRERAAGLYLADMFLMGSGTMLSDLKPAGELDPIKPRLMLPEVVDPNAWYGGGQVFQDKEGAYVVGFFFSPKSYIAYNSDVVKAGDLKSGSDLLKPPWKGKITMNDPTTSGGPGGVWFQMAYKALGAGFMQDLAKQDVFFSRDYRLQTEWVARGKYAVLIGTQEAALSEFINAGAPFKYLWHPDAVFATAGTGNICLMNKAAHPNAATVFINWLLSREGQTIVSRVMEVQSSRVDVPTDHLDPLVVRRPGDVYLRSDGEELVQLREAAAKDAGRIFGLGSK